MANQGMSYSEFVIEECNLNLSDSERRAMGRLLDHMCYDMNALITLKQHVKSRFEVDLSVQDEIVLGFMVHNVFQFFEAGSESAVGVLPDDMPDAKREPEHYNGWVGQLVDQVIWSYLFAHDRLNPDNRYTVHRRRPLVPISDERGPQGILRRD